MKVLMLFCMFFYSTRSLRHFNKVSSIKVFNQTKMLALKDKLQITAIHFFTFIFFACPKKRNKRKGTFPEVFLVFFLEEN